MAQTDLSNAQSLMHAAMQSYEEAERVARLPKPKPKKPKESSDLLLRVAQLQAQLAKAEANHREAEKAAKEAKQAAKRTEAEIFGQAFVKKPAGEGAGGSRHAPAGLAERLKLGCQTRLGIKLFLCVPQTGN